MDISPQLLREVEFREKWRGYSADEVDGFLERVAAGIEQLEARIQEADERAIRAERRVLETSDDDVRRALVLAQRTADAALAEARAAAEEQARAVRVDAEERAASELRELAARRAELEADVSALASYVREHRARLADELRGQLEWLKAPGRLALPEPPVAIIEPQPAPAPQPGPPVAAEPVAAEPVA